MRVQNKQNQAQLRRGKPRWTVCMAGHQDDQREELGRAKKGKKKMQGEAKDLVMAVWGYLPSSSSPEKD